MLIKDIVTLERVQRRATKFIVAASSVTYRDRLFTLNLLPLMYFYEYLDLLFLVHSLKFPDGSFHIRDHLQFSSHSTRSTSGIKLQVRFCPTNRSRHFFFNRVARLWNALPPIDLSLSISSIKASLKKILWAHFLEHFDSSNYCSYHFYVLAQVVTLPLQLQWDSSEITFPCQCWIVPLCSTGLP